MNGLVQEFIDLVRSEWIELSVNGLMLGVNGLRKE